MTHTLQSFQGSNDQATQKISSASDCKQQLLTDEDALRRQTLKALSLGLFGSASLGLTDSAHAQANYPSKSVRIIVPFSAGGTTDILAREMSGHFTERWKQSFVVENKGGAGGTLGTDLAVRAPADGYTLLCASVGPLAVNPTLIKKLSYNPLVDLVPIVLIADVSNVLVVHPSIPAKTVEEFIKLVEQNPDKFNYGSTGIGTAAHLSGALFGLRTKTKIQHIPYRGAEAVQDLLAGRIQFMFATAPSIMPQIKAGKVRALAVTSLERSRALPEVPTMKERGLSDFDSGSWFGFLAPKGVPDQVVREINKATNEALKLPAVQTKLVTAGADPAGGSPSDFYNFIKTETAKWRNVIIETGVEPQ